MRIRYIKAEETHILRQLVLRPDQPVEEMEWSGDTADTTFHLGVEVEGRLVSVATFLSERNEQLLGWRQYRLRGMATLPEQQGSGVGKALVRFALDHLRGLHADLVWCNAREKATGFYAGMGFSPKGNLFLLEGIGMHQLMYHRF